MLLFGASERKMLIRNERMREMACKVIYVYVSTYAVVIPSLRTKSTSRVPEL